MFQAIKRGIGQLFGTEQRSLTIADIHEVRAAMREGKSLNLAVNPTQALALSSYFASIKIISEAKAGLPIHVYEKGKDGKSYKTYEHPVYSLLSKTPNQDQTPFTFDELRTNHLLMWGNSYTRLRWNRAGEVTSAFVHMPNDVELVYVNGSRRYKIAGHGNYDRSRIMHVLGPTIDGERGLTPTQSYLREPLNMGISLNNCVAKYSSDGGTPKVIIEYEKELSESGLNNLVEQFRRQVSKRSIVAMEHGTKVHAFQTNLSDALLIGARELSAKEISCSVFGIPAPIAGIGDREPTDEDDRQFVKRALMPVVKRDVQTMNRDLFLRSENGRFEVRYNFNALVQGDVSTRFQGYRTGLIGGFMTVNEIRDLEDLPAFEDPRADEMPRPQAVWGKPEKPATNNKTPDKRSDDMLETLKSLAGDKLRGLVQREIEGLKRSIGKADTEQRISTFYDKHTPVVRERLQEALPGTSDTILGSIALRRSQVISEARSGDLTTDRLNHMSGEWLNEVQTITEKLIAGYQSINTEEENDDA